MYVSFNTYSDEHILYYIEVVDSSMYSAFFIISSDVSTRVALAALHSFCSNSIIMLNNIIKNNFIFFLPILI